jgi:hypothetical protein
MGALLIACSDGRLTGVLDALQQELGVEDCERMLVPGGPLALTRTGAERRVARECVAFIVETRAVRRVVLVSHQDCLSYERQLGGLGFDQRSILARDLRRARASLEDEHRGIDVDCFVVPWEEGPEGPHFGTPEAVE